MLPVELIKRRLMVENEKWKIYFDHLKDARGNEVSNFVVVAGQIETANQVTGVAVLPVLGDHIVLVRSYRHALGSHFWEVPHGFVDDGETDAQAALRELTEETGLVCDPSNLEPLGFYAPEAGTIAARGALFVAKRTSGTLRTPSDELGLTDVRSFNKDEVEALLANDEIEDAATLIVYYRYCRLAAGW